MTNVSASMFLNLIGYLWHFIVYGLYKTQILRACRQASYLFFYRSFAYLTIRDRLPVILTMVIDAVHRRATTFVRDGTVVSIIKFKYLSWLKINSKRIA